MCIRGKIINRFIAIAIFVLLLLSDPALATASDPAQPSASIDPNSLNVAASKTDWMTMLELKGTAPNSTQISIAVVNPNYQGKLDYATLTKPFEGQFHLFGPVENGRWDTTNFTGHPIYKHTGSYAVYVFDSSTQELLTTGTLTIH